jgi:hypothetical protein
MQRLFFEHSSSCNHYHLENASDVAISHLAFFLTDDTGCTGVQPWKDWLNNPSTRTTTSNYSYLKKSNETVEIWFEYDYLNNIPDTVPFKVTIAELNYILDRWQEACEKKPNKIIITRDQGKVTVDFED